MAEDSDDKTEEPTGKRLSEARNEGNLAQTAEARAMGSMLAALIVIGLLLPGMASGVNRVLVPFIERPHTFATDLESLLTTFLGVAQDLAWALAFPFLLTMAMAILVMVAQFKGFLWVPKKVAPDFKKINPLSGIKRLASPEQLVELAKQLFKLSVLGVVMGILLWQDLQELENLAQLDLTTILAYIHDRTFVLLIAAVLMIVAVAAADYAFQHWRWKEKMKMTKQEVKDENKQQEGDPQVKAKLRSLRIQRSRQRMMAAVPKADVVITNPTHYAVALKYDQEAMSAPVLVAKGVDLVAKRIRDLATESEVPVVENPPLARALYATVELDREIPPEHYKAVAEVIGYVMRLKGKLAH